MSCLKIWTVPVAFKLSKRKLDDNLQILHTILFGKKAKVSLCFGVVIQGNLLCISMSICFNCWCSCAVLQFKEKHSPVFRLCVGWEWGNICSVLCHSLYLPLLHYYSNCYLSLVTFAFSYIAILCIPCYTYISKGHYEFILTFLFAARKTENKGKGEAW